MADLKKRITSLTEKTTLTSGDFAAVDNTSGGTKKYNLYQLTQDVADNVSSIDSLETAVDGLTSDMAGKADADGSYEGMTAGNAEQLLSDVYTEDSEPYKYRASFSGDREFDEIVGGTVAWNQLDKCDFTTGTVSGITFTNNGNGTVTVSGTWSARAYKYINSNNSTDLAPNHVVALLTNVINGTVPNGFISVASFYNGTTYINQTNVSYAAIARGGTITKSPQDTTRIVHTLLDANSVSSGTTLNFTLACMTVDLTALFGSTIADYILAQEQATAGAGVAIFRKMFPASYYAYNAGELISVSGLSAHETVGKNMLPAPVDATKTSNGITITVKNGVYKITGTATGAAEIIFDLPSEVEINPNVKTAFLNDAINAGVVVYYRYNNTNLWSMGMGGNTNRVATYTTTSAVNRLRFLISSGTTIAGMMTLSPMLLFSATPNPTEFEPYQKHSYPLDSSLTLRGIPKLANGKMYFDGDTYASDGTVTRKYNYVVLDGTETITATDEGLTTMMFRVFVPNAAVYSVLDRTAVVAVSNSYTAVTWSGAPWYVDKSVSAGDTANCVRIKDLAYSTVSAFKAYLAQRYANGNPVTVLYTITTPTTETAEPYQNPQIVSEYGTEEYVSTTICPVGHVTKYPENLRKKIEGLPWDLSMIAPIENGTTASKAYSVGQYFLHNNVFCKAKTSIASGATFTLNTNYEETTVAAELYSALH